MTVPARAMYSLYADYFWYEIGDMVCIGDEKALYYCFPKSGRDIAAKLRLATEELYPLINPHPNEQAKPETGFRLLLIQRLNPCMPSHML